MRPRREPELPLRTQLIVIPCAIAGMFFFLWLESLSEIRHLDKALRICAWVCAILGSATAYSLAARAFRR